MRKLHLPSQGRAITKGPGSVKGRLCTPWPPTGDMEGGDQMQKEPAVKLCLHREPAAVREAGAGGGWRRRDQKPRAEVRRGPAGWDGGSHQSSMANDMINLVIPRGGQDGLSGP